MRRLLFVGALVFAALLLAGVGALLSLIRSVTLERSTAQ
jgi:hypothetical protein